MARHFVLFSRTPKSSFLRLFTCITSSLSAVYAFSATIGPNSLPSTVSASSQTSGQRTSDSNTSVVAITISDAIGGVVFLILLITLGIRYKRKAAHSSDVTSSPERQIPHMDSVTATISPASRGMNSIDGQTVSPDTFQHQNLPVGLAPRVSSSWNTLTPDQFVCWQPRSQRPPRFTQSDTTFAPELYRWLRYACKRRKFVCVTCQ
ncbi:hypothetical protein K503DRAFT_95578 [Rhizopogon vinicolor AM-OR11-026]|uniref:Uncharacterized protein n=1 Tax=Rhizopogon vinicolor AM-OR11-026 TaxID=1314800 RepID=A0A1B7MFI7_9AGAM|nr:hypothetical protein K503DRAFT_95578 [Rhizopogon vinicolor AM-OR11-026]